MDDNLRCSAWTRLHEVDPIGTAGCYAGLLLVEWPLPWPRDVADIPQLTDVAGACRRAGIRLQAVVGSGAGQGRVVLYRWQPEAGAFAGVEVEARDDVAAAARALLDDNPPAGSRPVEGRDVLVCGHGGRDRCCGSKGTALALTLQRSLGDGIRVWRTSHTGGHRFAPTCIVLPEGTCWGYLDPHSVRQILTRSGPVDAQLARYRGCLGLTSPAVQAVERAALKEAGWALLGWPRAGEELEDNTVVFRATSEDGEPRAWRARVVTRRVLPVPQCGSPVTEHLKTEAELGVEGLELDPFSGVESPVGA
jgi:hypothetical protein